MAEIMTAQATLETGMRFDAASGSGHHVTLDAAEHGGGQNAGFRPMELLLVGLAGCTGMDVISILRKKRQQVSGLNVVVQGSRAEQHPKVYTHINVLYRVRGNNVDPQAVERSIELSKTRYCPVIGMLGKVAEVTTRYEIEEETELTNAPRSYEE